MLGFVGGMMYFLFSPVIYITIILSVVILTGLSYYITATRGDIGATTEFSIIISFFLGTLVLMGKLDISLATMVVVVVLLKAKLQLRSIVGKITAEELYDFIRYVVIALLIFPFLPDQSYGPYDALNPREIGWVIILTSGLGFIGYILMKFLGAGRGILLSGIIGGLVSSTAVTWVFAKKSRENEGISQSCATAILAASSIMVLRVFVWTYIFNRALFNDIFVRIAIVFLAAIGVAIYFYLKQQKKDKTDSSIRQGKPLDLPGALVFGIIYIVILLVVNYANEQMGDEGLMISSAIAGLSDVDAITITISKLATEVEGFAIFENAILIAIISNTLVKMGIAFWAGSKELRKFLYIGYGLMIAVSILLLVL